MGSAARVLRVGNEDARKALQVPLSSQIKAMFCRLSKKKNSQRGKAVQVANEAHTLSLPFPLSPPTNLGKRATFKCLSNVNENVRLQEMPASCGVIRQR